MLNSRKMLWTCIILIVTVLCSGCSTYEFVKEMNQSINHMERLDDRLNRTNWETDAAGFKQVLEDIESEALRIRDLDTGLFKKLGKKDVLDFSDTVLALVEKIEQEVRSEHPDKNKMDELLPLTHIVGAIIAVNGVSVCMSGTSRW